MVIMKHGIVWFICIAAVIVAPCRGNPTPRTAGPFAMIKPLQQCKNTIGRKQSALLDSLRAALSTFESRSCDMPRFVAHTSDSSAQHDTVIAYCARVPRGRPLEWIVWVVSHAAAGAGYRLADCTLDSKNQTCFFIFSSIHTDAPRVIVRLTRSDKYAIGSTEIALIGEVWADTTYTTIVTLLSFPDSIALSVMSGRQQTPLIAQLAQRYHKEIVIRLPLEPASKIPADFPSPVIMVHYSKDMVHSLLSQAMKQAPHCAGLTNFWGSRAMEDSRIMSIIFNEIKKYHCYFLETPTTKNSVARALADSVGVAFGEINVALNGRLRQAEVEKQLRAYCAAARNIGAAMISFSVDAPSVAAIRACLPWFKQNGITLVFPSHIVKNRIE